MSISHQSSPSIWPSACSSRLAGSSGSGFERKVIVQQYSTYGTLPVLLRIPWGPGALRAVPMGTLLPPEVAQHEVERALGVAQAVPQAEAEAGDGAADEAGQQRPAVPLRRVPRQQRRPGEAGGRDRQQAPTVAADERQGSLERASWWQRQRGREQADRSRLRLARGCLGGAVAVLGHQSSSGIAS